MTTDSVDRSVLEASLPPTGVRAIAALGGAERWLTAHRVEAVVSVTGLAWWLKMRRPVPRTRLVVGLDSPHARLEPVDRTGLVGILDGNDARLEDGRGRVVASRPNAGQYFPDGRRNFYWDSLDLAYFAGTAMWNYFAFPRLLLRTDIEWREPADGTLEAHFPAELPTHSKVQTFVFDRETGLLARYDCTLEAVGAWARVAQFITDYGERDGIPYFGLRKVYLKRIDGSVRPWPRIITGRVFDWKLI